MRARLLRSTAAALVLATATACERIVDITVPDGPTRLVIDARIEHLHGTTGGPQRVLLTTTDAVFNHRLPPPASGARVEVRTGRNQTFVFMESPSAPGTYEIATMPTARGEQYTLIVDYDGERYEATDSVRAVPAIDTLFFEFQEANVFQENEGFRATIAYVDPAGVANFYLWEQWHDGERQLVPDVGNAFNVIGTDEVFDGQRVEGFQPNDETAVEPGQVVTVRQLGISRLTYDYYFSLFQQSANGEGSPFSVPAADVRGNVANLTRPDHYALGFFVVAEVAERTRRLPADATPP